MNVPQLSSLVRVTYGDSNRYGKAPKRGDIVDGGEWYVARVDEEDDRIVVVTIHTSLLGDVKSE